MPIEFLLSVCSWSGSFWSGGPTWRIMLPGLGPRGRKSRRREVATPAQILEDAGRAGRPVVWLRLPAAESNRPRWSTRVLTGLEEAVLRAKKADPRKYAGLRTLLDRSNALAVSPVEHGAMFFVAGYGDGGLPAPRLGSADPPLVNVAILPKILEAAEASSLGHAVWGMAYPDLRRAWFPFWIGIPTWIGRGIWKPNGPSTLPGPWRAWANHSRIAPWRTGKRTCGKESGRPRSSTGPSSRRARKFLFPPRHSGGLMGDRENSLARGRIRSIGSSIRELICGSRPQPDSRLRSR